jgi:hypothetical protein
MSGTWIVVADSSRARFFSLVSRVDPLLELDGMTHNEGRMRDLDEISDRLGGNAFEAPTDLKHHEAEVLSN